MAAQASANGLGSHEAVTAIERIVAGFARALRLNGLAVPTGSMLTYARALGLVGLDDPARVYWAGRATLLCRCEDVRTYDQVFAAYWIGRGGRRPAPESAGAELALLLDDPDARGAGPDAIEPRAKRGERAVRYSAVEVLSRRDLASLSQPEWAEAQRLISALRVTAELRPSRRTRPARRRAGGRPDLRATVRHSLAYGGVPFERAWRTPVRRPRRLVFVLDVSGSMEPYARGLLRFAHAAVTARKAGRVEVFTIGTRLTRITRELSSRDPDAALAGSADAVADWSGGTRLGSGIQELNDFWGVRGLARGAVVVICSDGWDRGSPELLGSEMARLARVAHRVVWVNPLKASPGYAPLARGMAAALPYVDQFVEGHAVSSLERLAGLISGKDGCERHGNPDASGREG